ECVRLQTQTRANPVVTTRYDDAVLKGFGVRPYNWDLSAEMQHQIGRDMSMTIGYYRNWYGNFRVTDNVAVSAADFNSYCVTAPKDSRLPNGGGYQVCDLYDISPAKFGLSNNLGTRAQGFGQQAAGGHFVSIS